MNSKRAIRCAIYTRKSSDEGLEQSFNSLQAQREACEAYIVSQKHEGWVTIAKQYDDGGFSGGTMERPALQRLLEDIKASKINVVIVYKVDRLTRSLADFAKIIEIFDAHSVSFVSVTQQFNTTSSMGRLTLNVLLSFAQFEREITSERIRDKIAASKKKGMWMGGAIPLGYDIQDRQLIINSAEADVVRQIFREYIRLGRVSDLRCFLRDKNILSKLRRSASGLITGGRQYSRGALYQILKSRLYIGEISHKGKAYPGLHEAIVDRDTWEKAAALLAGNNRGCRSKGTSQRVQLLTGLMFDTTGNRYTPTHASTRGKRYRYYTSQAVIQKRESGTILRRIPAHDIENVVISRIRGLLASPAELTPALRKAGAPDSALPLGLASAQRITTGLSEADFVQISRKLLHKVVLEAGRASLEINPTEFKTVLLGSEFGSSIANPTEDFPCATEPIKIDCRFKMRHWSNELRLVVPCASAPRSTNPTPLIRAIARARKWYEQFVSGEFRSFEEIAKQTGTTATYISKLFSLASLSPRLVEKIIRDPSAFRPLDKIPWEVPLEWERQSFATGADLREF